MSHYRSNSHIQNRLLKIEDIFPVRVSEVLASLIEQDLTFTAKAGTGEQGNLINIIYVAGAVAGAEVVTVVGNNIEVQIEDGVSDATQIKAALDGEPLALATITTSISGVGANPQSVFTPAKFLAGGVTEIPGKQRSFVFRHLATDVRVDGREMTSVDFQANGGLDITFDAGGSSFTVVKADITIINRLRTKRYLVDASAVTIV